MATCVFRYTKADGVELLAQIDYTPLPYERPTRRQLYAAIRRYVEQQAGALTAFEVVAEGMTAVEYIASQVREELKREADGER